MDLFRHMSPEPLLIEKAFGPGRSFVMGPEGFEFRRFVLMTDPQGLRFRIHAFRLKSSVQQLKRCGVVLGMMVLGRHH